MAKEENEFVDVLWGFSNDTTITYFKSCTPSAWYLGILAHIGKCIRNEHDLLCSIGDFRALQHPDLCHLYLP